MRVLLPIRLDRFQSPITTLLRAIVEANEDIQFISFSSPLTDEDRELGGKFWARENVRVGNRFDLVSGRYDIVHHASATKVGILAGRLNRLTSFGRAKYLFTANCQPYPTHPQLELLHQCARKASVTIPVSEIVSSDFRKDPQCRLGPVIPNGFDPKLYQPGDAQDVRAKYLEGSAEPFLLYASAFLDRKHPDSFLDLMEQRPNLKAVMVGSIPDEQLYQRICQRASSMPNIEVVGLIPRQDLRDLMREAAVMLYTSEYEGFPLTVIEAIGCGLPVIARPDSSLPELIKHGKNGWMYPMEETESWLSKTDEILGWSSEARLAFVTQARLSVVDKYSWGSIGKAYGDYYRSLCAQ